LVISMSGRRALRAGARTQRTGVWLLAACAASFGCKTAPTPARPAGSGAAPSGSAAPAPSALLLLAEQRRDPRLIAEAQLTAEAATERAAAVRTLARIQAEASFEPLSKALADESASVVSWAALGVGQLCRGHEPEAVRRLVMRATTLSLDAASPERDDALGSLALALGRCANDDAEKTLRAWLRLGPELAQAAALGLGQVARARKRLDDASVAALLDAAERGAGTVAGTALGAGAFFFAIESLPVLGEAARQRLLEVGKKQLDEPGIARAFAIRALAKAGPDAAPALLGLLEAEAASDAERADAARSLSALGPAAQPELAAALKSRTRALLADQAWLSSQFGVLLTVLDGLEPQRADPQLLAELAQLPLEHDAAPLVRRKVMVRCRAAALSADKSSASPSLLGCDPAPLAERREGSLALLRVLGRGSLAGARGARFRELASSTDRVVREAALELLLAHDEAPDIASLLASALAAQEVGVRATAAKVLARYPARAQRPATPATASDTKVSPPVDPRVVQALTSQLPPIGSSSEIELSSQLLDAAAALELLGAKPALERACSSSNPTLRRHAERGLIALGDRERHCANVPSSEAAVAPPSHDYRWELDSDVGPLTLTLWSSESPFATERLVELARAGFFDGMPVHRVVPGFVAQLGDPDGDGFGGPDLPPLRDQVGLMPFEELSVGIALAGRDTGNSQLFVALRRAPHLDGDYSVVGKAGPGWERLSAGDRILKVRVIEEATNSRLSLYSRCRERERVQSFVIELHPSLSAQPRTLLRISGTGTGTFPFAGDQQRLVGLGPLPQPGYSPLTMLLAVDIGNTNIVLGLYERDVLVQTFRVATVRSRTEDEYAVLLLQLLSLRELSARAVTAAIIASVVPQLTDVMVSAIRQAVGREPLIVGPGLKTGVSVLYDNPHDVGADRIVNAVAAYTRFEAAVIVVDFGTATTFDCISPKGEYLGGVIVPGVKVSLDGLLQSAAKLRPVELTAPPRVLGRNTTHALQSGVIHGYASMVDGLVERLVAELGYACRVVATGGLATLIGKHAKRIEEFDPDLTLNGLRILYERNTKARAP
jgi:pantothenate kinase type III